MNKKIEVCVIPVAGLGTRFLPATKAIAKEMLPIVDVPTLQIIVEEAKQSGIKKIIFVTSKNKDEIKNHFTFQKEREEGLRRDGKDELADSLNNFLNGIEIEYVFQHEQKGLGHAIYCAKDAVNGEDFGVLLGDDIVDNDNGTPALKQLIEAYNKVHATIIGVQKVATSELNKYGVVATKDTGLLLKMNGLVEKPDIKDAPSNYAALGRYVLTNDIFKALEETKPGKGGEIQLTDAINILLKTKEGYAFQFVGTRFDVGDKAGFVKATINYALKNPKIKEDVIGYIKNLDL